MNTILHYPSFVNVMVFGLQLGEYFQMIFTPLEGDDKRCVSDIQEPEEICSNNSVGQSNWRYL